MNATDWTDAEGAARALAGNHRRFDSFAWYDRPDDDENWAILYCCNRDSDLLAQSNAAAIARELAPFLEADEPDVVEECHGHFLCGWVDGFAIRCFDRDGQVTDAFRKWCELQQRLEECGPVLDEEDYARRGHEDTIVGIRQSCARFLNGEEEEGWEERALEWFDAHDPAAVAPRDGGGGYPREGQAKACLFALGLLDSDLVFKVVADGVEEEEHLDLDDALASWERKFWRRLGEEGRVFVTCGQEVVHPEA